MVHRHKNRAELEQSAVVWHSSLTQKNIKDLERVQKVVVRIIRGKNYTIYKKGLKFLKLDTLEKKKRNSMYEVCKKTVRKVKK